MATPTYGYSAAKQTTKAPVYTDPTVRRRQQSDSLFQTPLIAPTGARPKLPQNVSGSFQYNAPKTAAPAAAAPPHAPVAPAAAAQAPLPMYDYTTDPILQQIQGLGVMDRGNADAGALAVKKQIAIQYGDPSLANQLGDTETATAATNNPYSAFAQLRKTNDQNVHALDENLNANNLFYSGARITQQQQLADQYGQAYADQTANEQGALGQTEQQRLAAYLAADQRDLQGQGDAQSRSLQMALANQPAPVYNFNYPDPTASTDTTGADALPPSVAAARQQAAPLPLPTFNTTVPGLASQRDLASSLAPFSGELTLPSLAAALSGYGTSKQRRKQAA